MNKADKFEQMLRLPFKITSIHLDSSIHEGMCDLCDETLILGGDDFCRIEFGDVGFAYAHLSCAMNHERCQGHALGVERPAVKKQCGDADSDEIWEGSREQLHKALDFLEVVAEKSLWFVAMKVEGAPPEREFRVRRATPDEVAS